jgi:hypothetical protein
MIRAAGSLLQKCHVGSPLADGSVHCHHAKPKPDMSRPCSWWRRAEDGRFARLHHGSPKSTGFGAVSSLATLPTRMLGALPNNLGDDDPWTVDGAFLPLGGVLPLYRQHPSNPTDLIAVCVSLTKCLRIPTMSLGYSEIT